MDNHGKKKGKIQNRLILYMLLIGIVPGALIVALAYVSGINALKNSIAANFQEMAKETADRVQILIEDEIEEAQKLALSPDIRAAILTANKAYAGKDDSEIQKKLDKIQLKSRPVKDGPSPDLSAASKDSIESYMKEYQANRAGEFVAILIADKKGVLVNSTGPEKPYQGGEDWWRKTVNGGKDSAYISGIEHKEGTLIYTVAVAVPVIDPAGRTTIGAIKLVYDIRDVFRTINDVKMGETGHANLVTSDGTLVVCPIFAPQSHKINENLMRQISGAKPGWGIAGDDAHGGNNSIIGFAPVIPTLKTVPGSFGGKTWHIFIRQLPEETYAPMYSLLRRIYLLGAVFITAIIFMGVYASRKIVRPIRLLTRGAELIKSGRLDHRITVKTDDEIQQLAETFNEMTENLETGSIERARYLKQLKESGERYRNFFDYAEDSMFLVDTDGEVVATNKRQEEILGYPGDSILGYAFSRLVADKYKDLFNGLFERTLMGEKPPTTEVEIKTRNGNYITMDIDLTGFMRRESLNVQIHLRDVTRRKVLEKEILLERNKLEAIIEGMGDGLNIVDMDYRVRFVNKRLLDLYGKEVIGSRCYEVYTGGKTPCDGCPIPEDTKKTGFLEVATSSGRTLMITYSPLSVDGAPAILEIIKDITEKKKLESAIERLELYNILFDYAEDSMFMVDTDGKVISVNKRQEDVIGYSGDSVIGQRFSSILAAPHRDTFKEFFGMTLDGKKPPTVEVELLGRRGNSLTMEMDITSIERGGERAFVLVHLRDITERKELERQLLMAERLTAVSHFSSALAHDLRNPIIGIKKTLTSLKATVSSSRPEAAGRTLTDLIAGSELLLGMVNDVLDVHLNSYDELPLIISDFPLVNAVEEAIKLLRIEAEEKRIKVFVESEDLSLTIHGDKRRLQRVFINLLDNAIKYSGSGSNIHITFKPIEEEQTDYLLFSIEDEGIGIAPSNLTRIFEPLYQTAGKKDSAKIGTGLGLYFCKVVIDAHHGKIWAENRKEKGSAFFIKIPL